MFRISSCRSDGGGDGVGPRGRYGNVVLLILVPIQRDHDVLFWP